MRILICNDDGFDAPGLAELARAAQAMSTDVWIVAPARKWTAASHQLSFDRDLTLTRRAPRTYVCSGAPADCVVAAMTVLFADGPRPDLVLAGVNDKHNVAEDLAYSGTMAIAREGTFWGVPSIGVSQANGVTDAPALHATLRALLPALWQDRTAWGADGHWLGVNLPAALPAPLAQARVGRDKIAGASDVLLRSDDSITYRIRRGRAETRMPGDENSLLDAGCVTVTRHGWDASAPLAPAVLAAWNEALARSGAK